MAASTTVNGRTVVHRDSGGVLATFPDVCLTPTPGGPVPIPYPNIARSADLADGSSTVTVDGVPVAIEGSVFSTSTGDEPGVKKGVLSQAHKGEARFLNWSFDVKVEGKGVCRLLDPMASNAGSPPNTPPSQEVQPTIVVRAIRGHELDHRHLLLIAFEHAHTDADTPGTPPDFLDVETPIRFTGPENETWSPVYVYQGVTAYVWNEGSYTMRFDSFDLEPRDLLPPSIMERAVNEALNRLERAKRAADNAVEDMGEVADRMERDVVRAGSRLNARARAAVAQARVELAQAQADAAATVDRISGAISSYESGDWLHAASEGVGAAGDGIDASQRAIGALRDLSSEMSGSVSGLGDDLMHAIEDAELGLRFAARDAQSAVDMSN